MRSGWNPVWYVAAALIVGFAIGAVWARLSGTAFGIDLVLILVAVVTAIVTLAGPILAERSRQEFDREVDLTRRKEEHALELAESPFSGLSTTTSQFSTFDSADTVFTTSGLRCNYGSSGQGGPIEGAPFWVHGLAHISYDPKFKPVLTQMLKLAERRADSRFALDELTKAKATATFRKVLGGDTVIARNLPGAGPSRWIDIGNIIRAIRMDPVIEVTSTIAVYGQSRSTGTQEIRTIFSSPGWTLGATVDPPDDAVTAAFTAAIRALQDDSELKAGFAELNGLCDTVEDYVPKFRLIAWEYFQHVRLSKSLDGTCPDCPRLS